MNKTALVYFKTPFFIFSIVSLLFLLLLNDRPLNNPDESRYSEIAFEMLRSGDFITPRFNGVLFLDKPPLYYWLQATAIKVFGPSNGSLRFFPALFALMGGLCVYSSCQKLFNKQTALLSALILLSAPLYFFIGLYANLDMEVAVLISNALLFFAVAELSNLPEKKSRNYYYAAYFSAALAVLTKGLIGIVLPALSVLLWLLLTRQLHRLPNLKIPSGLSLIVLINLPWYYFAEKATPGFLHFFFIEQQFTRFVSHQFNAQNPWYFYPGLLLAGTFPWSVFSLQALYIQLKKVTKFLRVTPNTQSIKSSESILLYFLCWLISITVFFSLPASKLASYIIPAMPPLAILMAHYLTHEGLHNKLIPQALYTQLLISAFLFIGIIIAAKTHTLPFYGTLYILIATGTLLITALLSCLIKKRTTQHALFAIASLSLCFFLIKSVPYWIEFLADKKPTISSTQKLAKILSKTPNIPIYAYKSFYYDLPILLKDPVKIVENWHTPGLETIDSWIGKFAWGEKKEGKKNPYLVLPHTFWKKWNDKKNAILVITRKESLQDFKSYTIIGEHKRNILLSNHKNIGAKSHAK